MNRRFPILLNIERVQNRCINHEPGNPQDAGVQAMTAMMLYLTEATRREAEQTQTASGALSMHVLLVEIIQILKGVILPMHHSRAALGDHLTGDLGLR
jgi:hypothetical protein